MNAFSTNRHTVYVGTNDNWLVVEGDGDTDLDCWIYNVRGQLVDSDRDDTDVCILKTPGLGQHRLVVQNLGRVYNEYSIRKQSSLY